MPALPRVGAGDLERLVWDLALSALRAIEQAGGHALPTPDLETADLGERGDGLLLLGGGDVDPGQYRERHRHSATGYIDTNRDQREIVLARWAVDARVPVLALCRGMQIVNVALGGTLTQHLENTSVEHYGHRPDHLMVEHDVSIVAFSRLASIVGDTKASVWSGHHQALDQMAAGLHPTAYDDDDLVEAFEHDRASVVGVQWHPEYRPGNAMGPDPLFVDLVERSRAAAALRRGPGRAPRLNHPRRERR